MPSLFSIKEGIDFSGDVADWLVFIMLRQPLRMRNESAQ
jgi:hypothetical protein